MEGEWRWLFLFLMYTDTKSLTGARRTGREKKRYCSLLPVTGTE